MLGKKLNAKAKAKKLLAVVLSALSVGSVGVYAEGGADSGEPRSDVAVNNANVVRPPYRFISGDGFKLEDGFELENRHNDAFWNEDISKRVWDIYKCCEVGDYRGLLQLINETFEGGLFIPLGMILKFGERIRAYLGIPYDKKNLDDKDNLYFKDMTRKKLLGIICFTFFVAGSNDTIFAPPDYTRVQFDDDDACPFPQLPGNLIRKLLSKNAQEMTPRWFSVENVKDYRYVETEDCNILISYINFISLMREELFFELREMTGRVRNSYLSIAPANRTLFENWLHSDTIQNFVTSNNALIGLVRGLRRSRELRESRLRRRLPL